MKELEALLKAATDAKAEAEANPTDKVKQKAAADAQKAYDDAKAAADLEDKPNPDDVTDPDFDESKADEATKKYIAKLRKENASHRTKSKDLASKLKLSDEQKRAILKAAGIESEDEKPEEKISKLTQETQTQSFRLAILESAMQHGVPRDQVDFYEFLVSKATSQLEEGEELSEEALAEIVTQVKASGKTPANTKPGKEGDKTPPPGSDANRVTLEKFISMSMMEKSALYTKNEALYTELMTQAKAKRKLV
jgi:hypothetical protein